MFAYLLIGGSCRRIESGRGYDSDDLTMEPAGYILDKIVKYQSYLDQCSNRRDVKENNVSSICAVCFLFGSLLHVA